MRTILTAAAILSLLAGPALAAPQRGADRDITQVKQGDGNRSHHNKGDWRGREAFNDHDRYRGWQHYSHRPDNWRDRGCIEVGPLWYCQ